MVQVVVSFYAGFRLYNPENRFNTVINDCIRLIMYDVPLMGQAGLVIFY